MTVRDGADDAAGMSFGYEFPQDEPPENGDNSRSLAARARYIAAVVFALFVHAIFAGLAIAGGLIVHAVARDWRAGLTGTGEALFVGAFGALLAVIGLGFFYVAYVGAPRFLARFERNRAKYRDRPWLADRRWRARRVVHSTRYTAWFMWFWCAAWWGIVGFIWSVNRDLIIADLKGPWSAAIPASLPFVAGIIGLLVAVSVTWRRWRHGDAVLLIDTLPGYLGERFRGRIEAGLKERPNEPVTLTLMCGSLERERVSTSQGTETRLVTHEIWSTDTEVSPAGTTFGRGRVSVPVDFDLPEDLPESGHILDDPQIVWTVEVHPGSVLDRGLRSNFQVPVFARRHSLGEPAAQIHRAKPD